MSIRRAYYLVLICGALGLASCATLNEKQCRVGDWSAYGKIDGAHGRPSTYFQEHEASCGRFGVALDKQAYLEGWKEGLANYCTPESGFYAGSSGEAYYGVCAGAAEKAFLTELNRGRRLAQLRAELSNTDTELTDLRNRMSQQNGTQSVLDAFGLTPDGMRRRQLEDHHVFLAGEVTEIESAAPAASPMRSELTMHALAPGFGALTGTFLGFGIGHAIQGRYAERGWFFTALETGILAGAIGGSSLCASGNCSNTFGGLGAVLFIGAKVWESIDVWRYYSAALAGYPHLRETTNFTPSTPIAQFRFPLTF